MNTAGLPKEDYPRFFLNALYSITFLAETEYEAEMAINEGCDEVPEFCYNMAKKSFASGHTYESIIGKGETP